MYLLRELERGDLLTVTSWRSRRDVVDCLGAPYRYIGPEVDQGWFDGYLAGRSATVRCAVADAADPSKILGLATLASIDWVHRSCTFHIMVGPEAQGRGVGKFALGGMLRHAFCDLGLNRVELAVLESNVRARSLYEKFGFMLEGTRRQAAYKNGRWEGVHTMGLLRSEWEALPPASPGSGDPAGVADRGGA